MCGAEEERAVGNGGLLNQDWGDGDDREGTDLKI